MVKSILIKRGIIKNTISNLKRLKRKRIWLEFVRKKH